MEWQQLEYFRAVAREQHFTAAARRLMVSQPAISRSVSRLEHELGLPLFDRVGRSVRLNRYGRAFLRRVERALDEIAKGQRELADMVGPVRGSVAVGFIQTFGAQFLPDLVAGFRVEHPQVEFKLSQGSTGLLLDQLVAGETDLCLLSTHPELAELSWARLFDEEIYAVVPSGHRLARRKSIRLAELANDSFITFKQGWGLRQLNEELCQRAGFQPKATFEGDEIQTVYGLVAAGLGVALIPPLPVSEMQRATWLHVSDPRCERTMGLAWIQDRYLSAVAILFRDFIIQSFAPSAPLQFDE